MHGPKGRLHPDKEVTVPVPQILWVQHLTVHENVGKEVLHQVRHVVICCFSQTVMPLFTSTNQAKGFGSLEKGAKQLKPSPFKPYGSDVLKASAALPGDEKESEGLEL